MCAAVVLLRCDVFSQTAIPLQLGHHQVHVLPALAAGVPIAQGALGDWEMTADKSHAVEKVDTVIKKSELQGGYYRQARSGL